MKIISKFDTANFSRRFSRIVAKAVFVIISGLFTGFAPPQKREARDETEVKAVFLFNFAQFVEWPTEVLPATNSPIVIGILGEDPFGVYLEETIRGEVVNGHPLKIERYASAEEIQNCHILFINPGRTVKVEPVLTSLKGRNILTVSDAMNFARQGGMIRFVNEGKRIKLQVRLSAVRESGVSISSKLLSLSEIVD